MTGSTLPDPARYVPVRPGPLRMQAGLRKFPEDFGNGPADTRIFQRDVEVRRYLADKGRPAQEGGRAPRARAWVTDDPGDREVLDAALVWTADRAAQDIAGFEVRSDVVARLDPLEALDALAMHLQEDLAILRLHEDGRHRLVAGHVCFPSGWRPERLVGASFDEIHRPVPEFADDPRASTSMARSMVERGPYVRFVWTVSADDVLDHHPEDGVRSAIPGASQLWLRVERQLTVPFPEVGGSLFVIRTFLYPVESLTGSQRADLGDAMRAMPETIAAYKGLAVGRATILDCLDHLAAVRARGRV